MNLIFEITSPTTLGMQNLKETIGRNIRRLMARDDIKQEALVKALKERDTWWEQPHLSRYSNGKVQAPLERVQQLADYFRVPINQILEEQPENMHAPIDVSDAVLSAFVEAYAAIKMPNARPEAIERLMVALQKRADRARAAGSPLTPMERIECLDIARDAIDQ